MNPTPLELARIASARNREAGIVPERNHLNLQRHNASWMQSGLLSQRRRRLNGYALTMSLESAVGDGLAVRIHAPPVGCKDWNEVLMSGLFGVKSTKRA